MSTYTYIGHVSPDNPVECQTEMAQVVSDRSDTGVVHVWTHQEPSSFSATKVCYLKFIKNYWHKKLGL